MTGPFVSRRAALVSIVFPAILAAHAEAGEPGAGGGARRRLARFGEENIVDNALLDLAEFYLGKGRTAEGVATLERVAAETPDRGTRAVAHFNLANIFETTLNDPARARSEYAKVTGPFAGPARGKVLGPLRAEKRWVEAADFLRECLAACEEPEDKAEVIRTLTGIARASGDEGLLESTLRSVPELITYKEAEDAASAESKKFEEMQKRIDAARASSPPGPAAAGRPAPRKRSPRPVPPPAGVPTPARAAGRAAELEAQIRELERAGFVDEARQLHEELKSIKENEKPDQF